MNYEEWKANLVNEIQTSADSRAAKSVGEPNDPRLAESQSILFALAEQIKSMPADHETLVALFNEEAELATLAEAGPDEAEHRYHDSKEQLLQSIGIDHEPFDNPHQFLAVLRNMVDETITEYRLR